MYKKTIKYKDYEGNDREEDFYFNLSKAELMEYLMGDGGYTIDKVLERIYKESNGKKICETFRNLIYISYGEKSLDGRRFIKTDEVKRSFMETEAYSALFMDIIGDTKKSIEFVTGIIPKELADEVRKAMEDNKDALPEDVATAIS